MTQLNQTQEAMRAGQPGQTEQKNPAPEPASGDDQAADDEEGEDKLDEAIEMTFPASDPVSI